MKCDITKLKKSFTDRINEIEDVLNLKKSMATNTPYVIKVNDFYTIGIT